MGYLLHLLVALITLAAAGDVALAHPPWGGAVVPALALVPVALGALVQRLLVRGRFREALVFERALAVSPVVLQALALLVLDWGGALQRWTGLPATLGDWPGLELFAGIAPFLLYEAVAIDARARLGESRPGEVRRVRAFQLRLFLSALLPLALFVAVSSAIGASARMRAYVEEVAVYGALFSVVMLSGLVLVLPGLLRHTWDTVPIERGGLRSMLEELSRAARFRCRELLVWRTANQMANAAIVGFTPRSRIVLFSDALLAQLRPDEVAAVFAHEMGHARRHHAFFFAGFAVSAFLCVDLVLAWLDIGSQAEALTLFGGLLLLAYLAFGYLSRRFELEADLESLELVGDPRPLIDALHAVVGAHAHRRSSWRHFSAERRVRFLAETAADPGIGRRLRRILRGWKSVISLVLVLVLAAEGRSLAGSWSADHARAHLRLGEYERAAELVGRIDRPDPDLAAEVAEALTIPPERRTAEALAARAREALARGDWKALVLDLRLALYRGADPSLETLLSALLEEEPLGPAVRGLPPDHAGPWREALERLRASRR